MCQAPGSGSGAGRSPLPVHDLEIKNSANGCTLRLRVKPGARKDAVLGVYGGALKVSVKAAPERGRANEAVTALLAAGLALPRDHVTVVSGRASRDKTVRISRMEPEELRRRLPVAWAILGGINGGQNT